jgi:hypothetical protein
MLDGLREARDDGLDQLIAGVGGFLVTWNPS